MIGRIDERFAALKKAGKAALIPFIMGGDPDDATTLSLLRALAEAGADIIEIGIPFSDPMADGPVIQAAGGRALKGGATVERILKLVAEFRKTDGNTPIILMGYYNPVYRFGGEKFCAAAKKAGADGLILVDLPPEEEAEFRPHAEQVGLALIRLIAPTSVPGRLKQLLAHTQGFAYYISITGITGAKGADTSALSGKLSEIRKHTKLPVAVGFGVKTPAQAAEIAKLADAVVVGSALVDIISKAKNPVQDAATFVRELAQAMKH